jgi:hypothetical protein
MTVYVDDMRARHGQHILCHMIADSEEELHAMAERIGMERRRYQGDHYDIPLAQKDLALAAGAREIRQRQLACMVWLKRHGHGMGERIGGPGGGAGGARLRLGCHGGGAGWLPACPRKAIRRGSLPIRRWRACPSGARTAAP